MSLSILLEDINIYQCVFSLALVGFKLRVLHMQLITLKNLDYFWAYIGQYQE